MDRLKKSRIPLHAQKRQAMTVENGNTKLVARSLHATNPKTAGVRGAAEPSHWASNRITKIIKNLHMMSI